jgi:squalene-hopene/tetraprenyl-beta-curcumene cyclase
VRTSISLIRRSVAWLKRRQTTTAGGRDLDSYGDASLGGSGPSTPSQTAALLGARRRGRLEPRAGARDRAPLPHAARRRDLDELHFTGTGFPRHFYLRYYMYRNYFPLMALGIFHARRSARAA